MYYKSNENNDIIYFSLMLQSLITSSKNGDLPRHECFSSSRRTIQKNTARRLQQSKTKLKVKHHKKNTCVIKY